MAASEKYTLQSTISLPSRYFTQVSPNGYQDAPFLPQLFAALICTSPPSPLITGQGCFLLHLCKPTSLQAADQIINRPMVSNQAVTYIYTSPFLELAAMTDTHSRQAAKREEGGLGRGENLEGGREGDDDDRCQCSAILTSGGW